MWQGTSRSSASWKPAGNGGSRPRLPPPGNPVIRMSTGPENCTPWRPASAGGPPLTAPSPAAGGVGPAGSVHLSLCPSSPAAPMLTGRATKLKEKAAGWASSPQKPGWGQGACMRALGEACGTGGSPVGSDRQRPVCWHLPRREAGLAAVQRARPPSRPRFSGSHKPRKGRDGSVCTADSFLHSALCPADWSRKSTLDWGSSLGQVIL